MERGSEIVLKICKIMYIISGVTLVLMMFITAADVILRALGRPISGAFELVALMASVTIGFGLPYTSWVRAHVYMEFLIEKIPKQYRNAANIGTRLIGVATFGLLAYNLFVTGIDLHGTGEVSPTLQLPLYPVSYGLSISSFMLCIVLIWEIVKPYGGHHE